MILYSEISLLKELKHANIVSLMDVLMEDNRLYLIFEFLSMDLKKYMDSLPAERMMDPELVRSYLYQITAAMLFCHRRRVLHRDLKVGVKGEIGQSLNFFIYRFSPKTCLLTKRASSKWLTSDWGALSEFLFVTTLTRSSHCGIAHQKFSSAVNVIPVLLTSGRLVASLLKWLHESRFSKATPKSINFFECSASSERQLKRFGQA